VVDLWLHDIESLEAVAQDETTRQLCLEMAAMSQAGTLDRFLASVDRNDELDEFTRAAITELAGDARFLLTVDEYVRRTRLLH
jgi:hypothetical protein